MMLNYIQPHTIEIYELKGKQYSIENVKARSLLSVSRFDLFAKLYYARLRKTNYESAIEMYVQHIKAFNPDFREPGRIDKVSLENFVSTFDNLLDYFEDNEFDENISVIPVDEKGVILDGAHRVAALAFYDKNVTIVRFVGVRSKGPFDYLYFKSRGLSWKLCDIIANEIALWREDILLACLWPRMGDSHQKDDATTFLGSYYNICYMKEMYLSLKTMTDLISLVYRTQPWVTNADAVADKSINCYGNHSHVVRFVLLQSSINLEQTISVKEALRNSFHIGKHSVHITDNVKETRDLLPLICTPEGEVTWNFSHTSSHLYGRISEWVYYFRKVQIISMKCKISMLLSKLFRR